MRKIAVVIPYYQRDAGILGRALASVFAQDSAGAEIRILVVDDASPFDPVKEIEAAEKPPAHVSVEIIRRENGGPGAARNTGFEAAKFADYIAMLDSDDTWRPGHLKRALEALNDGADVYFSDHIGETGVPYFPKTQFIRRIGNGEPEVEPSTVPHVRTCPGAKMAEFAAREYLAHTSSIVYGAAKLGHLRMSTQLRSAGEDHLFFLDLCLGSARVAFSTECEVTLGEGVNIYVGAFEWGSERDLRRRIFNLGALKMMSSRTVWASEFQREFARRKDTMRRSIGFLFVRRMLSQRKPPMRELKLAWSFDKASVLMTPFSAIDFTIRRMLGGEKFLSDIE